MFGTYLYAKLYAYIYKYTGLWASLWNYFNNSVSVKCLLSIVRHACNIVLVSCFCNCCHVLSYICLFITFICAEYVIVSYVLSVRKTIFFLGETWLFLQAAYTEISQWIQTRWISRVSPQCSWGPFHHVSVNCYIFIARTSGTLKSPIPRLLRTARGSHWGPFLPATGPHRGCWWLDIPSIRGPPSVVLPAELPLTPTTEQWGGLRMPFSLSVSAVRIVVDGHQSAMLPHPKLPACHKSTCT